jgi:hypothetical protein
MSTFHSCKLYKCSPFHANRSRLRLVPRRKIPGLVVHFDFQFNLERFFVQVYRYKLIVGIAFSHFCFNERVVRAIT